jgi:proline racemase
MELDYLKGHMGNNIIIFLYGDQIPKGRELEAAVEVLQPHRVSGHETGILYPPVRGGDLMVKIVGFTSRAFITACGGLTQVLGKAAVETELGRRCNLPIREPETRISLETEAGPVPITAEVVGGKAKRVWTDMGAFVTECYELGVSQLELTEVPAIKVGKFLVLDGDKVKRHSPEADFEAMTVRTREILLRLQDEFKRQTFPNYHDFSLCDWHPQSAGDLRVLFPHNLASGHVEPACGTGFVATGIGLWELGELRRRGLAQETGARVRYECGGAPVLAGSDLAFLELTCADGRVTGAAFSHSLIEIMEEGRISL